MLKAIFKGWLTIHVLAFIAALAVSPFWWTLVLVFYRGALFLDNGVSSAFPWLLIPLAAVILGTGGYVAAANTRPHRMAAGFLLSVVMVFWIVLGVSLGGGSGATDLLSTFTSLICIMVFPPIGAFVARKWRRSDEPPRPLRKAHVMLAYALLPMGVLLPLMSWLLWRCWMHGSRVANDPDASAGLITPSIWIAVAGLLLIVYAVIVFVKRRGWKKGIVINWYVYVVAIMAIAFCFGFLARERENRWPLRFAEGPEGYIDSVFVFPDPANPATLYIQASALIPEEDDSDEEDPLQHPFSAAEKLELTALVADRSQALTLAFRADDKAVIRFPQYGVKDIEWRCYHLLRLCETLAARARLDAGKGDVPETLRCLRRIIRISKGLSKSGTLNMVIGCGCRSIVFHVIRDMLRLQMLSGHQLSLIAKDILVWETDVLPDRQRWASTARSMVCELECDTIEEVFRSLRRGSPWSFMSSQFVSKRAMLARRSQIVDACLSKPTWSTMLDAFRAEDKACGQYRRDPFFAPMLGKVAREVEELARADMSNMDSVIERILAQLARVRLLRASAAALLYRNSKGKLPTAWSDLVPAYLPSPLIDPFSDKPLLLRSGEDGFCIYSVGENGEDDGGTGLFSVEEGKRDDSEGCSYSDAWVEDIAVVVPKLPGNTPQNSEMPQTQSE
jgi:hypothetical protein